MTCRRSSVAIYVISLAIFMCQWIPFCSPARGLPPRLLVRTYARMPLDRWDAELTGFAPATLEHRITLRPELWSTDASAASVVRELLTSVPTPTSTGSPHS